MGRPMDLDDLLAHWTLRDDQAERDLLAGKRGATRLGFALLLSFYRRHGRFPRGRAELPDDAVEFVARQVRVAASELGFYEFTDRTARHHQMQIRQHLGFRECSVDDADKLTEWLAANVCEAERRPDQVRAELLAQFRAEQVEPPTSGRMNRMISSALRTAERSLTARIAGRLPAETVARLRALVLRDVDEADQADPAGVDVLSLIKSVPGNVSLETMLAEIGKLRAVRAVELPADLFADVAPKVLAGWRSRAAVESPSHLRDHPEPLMLTLLAALLHNREREITDTLVDLLIKTVHRIGARADRKVTDELVNAFKKVTGKENILFAIAEASLGRPDEAVRQVVYPAVTGGEATLRELVHEYKTKGPVYRRTVATTLRASYTNHYRRGLIELLEVLEFHSNNTAHRPVLDALDLIRRLAGTRLIYYPPGEHVPTHRGVASDWSGLVFKDVGKQRRVVRSVYEIATFQALRDQLRCKEIWVTGAGEYRDPEHDLPADFAARRVEHYAELRQPMDPTAFIDALREEMRTELAALNDQIPVLEWVEVRDRGKQGAIKFTRPEALPEPVNLRRLKNEVGARWGTVALIDMLKEAVLRTGCLHRITAATGRGDMPADVLAERLLLVMYGYGTNIGLRAVAAASGHSEDDLRYVRRRYLSAEVARMMAIEIANATFAARHHALWGTGSTAVASDSTHVGAFDQNIFTEWHNRYGGRGVLIYWHVEAKSMAIHSQLLNCSASEVAAMVDGAIRHGTSMQVEGNYVDTHGQSDRVRHHPPARLRPAPTDQTDQQGPAVPVGRRGGLRRIPEPRAGDGQPGDPLGSDRRTVRPDDQVRDRDPHRHRLHRGDLAPVRQSERDAPHLPGDDRSRTRPEDPVHRPLPARPRTATRDQRRAERLESWNRGNEIIFFGGGGEIASNRRDEQELSVLCLRVLQCALVYVNTLMLQDVLAEDAWADLLTADDRRGLTPLFWAHITPYGDVHLDMTTRLRLSDRATG